MEVRSNQVAVVKHVSYHDFMLADIQPLPDGGAQVTFIEPNGTAHSFPLKDQAAKQLGKQLLAPRLAVAGNGDHPV